MAENQSYVDEMTLSYNGNQLSKVCDLSSAYKYNTVEYPQNYEHPGVFQYDTNGNLIAQTDKNIATIRYNVLNLPDTIQFKSGNQIVNNYFADGTHYRTAYRTCLVPPTVPVATGIIHQGLMNYIEDTYLDKYQLNGGRLSRIMDNEGYTSVEYRGVEQPPTYIPHYVVRDHLGNTRTVKSLNSGLEQSMEYYASGTPLSGSYQPEFQPNKFGNKELISMHELNWYNFGARYYDPVITRFTTPDPLAELNVSMSPYVYCSGNPVNRIDPTGLYDLPGVTVTASKLDVIVTASRPNTDYSNSLYFQNMMSDWSRGVGGTASFAEYAQKTNSLTNINVKSDWLRKITHKISKIEQVKKMGLKSGKMYEKVKGLTSISSKLPKAIKGLGYIGDAISVAEIGVDMSDGYIKPSSIYSGAMVVGAITVGFLAGPEIVAGVAIYGFFDATFDGGGQIDKMFDNKEFKLFDK